MFVPLGFLPDANYSQSVAVSADGSTVVGYSSGETVPDEAFRWTQAGGIEGLGVLPGAVYSYPYGVSADGSVVVGSSYDGAGVVDEACCWTQGGGIEGLGVLTGGAYSFASGVSADGTTVVGSSYGGSIDDEAFRLDAGRRPPGPWCPSRVRGQLCHRRLRRRLGRRGQ